MIIEQGFELPGEALGDQEILQADRAACDLVLIGRADAAPGGADLGHAFRRFPRNVEGCVEGKYQWTGLRNAQASADFHAGGFQLVHLLDQRLGRQHHAVADVTVDALPEDARGNQVQHGFLAADHQGMPGVVPALEAHHPLRVVGEPVHDLPFPFVTPLGAYDDDVLGHRFSSCPVFARSTCRRA